MYQILQSTGRNYYLDLIVNRQSVRLYYGPSALQACMKVQTNIPLRVLPDAILANYFTCKPNKGIMLKLGIEPVKRRKSGYSLIPKNRTGRKIIIKGRVK